MENDFEALVEENRARELNNASRSGASLTEDELFEFVSENVSNREVKTGVDALTSYVDASVAQHTEEYDEQVLRPLLERLDKELVVTSQNTKEGDFWVNNRPAPAVRSVSVSGNTFDVRDQLKRLGFRFNPNSKMWTLVMGKRGLTKSKFDAAEKAVRDLVATQNKRWRDEDAEQLKTAGHSQMQIPREPKKFVKMIDGDGRLRKKLEKHGVVFEVKLASRVPGFSNSKAPVVLFSGNTYPLRSVFKKNQFSWKGGSWAMLADNFAIVQKRFFQELMRQLGKAKSRPDQDEEKPTPDVGINKRLQHFKATPEFSRDQARARRDPNFAEVFDDNVAAGYYDAEMQAAGYIEDVDPNDANALFEALAANTEFPIEEAEMKAKTERLVKAFVAFAKKEGEKVTSVLEDKTCSVMLADGKKESCLAIARDGVGNYRVLQQSGSSTTNRTLIAGKEAAEKQPSLK